MTENEDIRLQCEDISQDEHVDFNPKYPDAADPDVPEPSKLPNLRMTLKELR